MVKKLKAIKDLTPDSRNANKGTVRGQAMLEDSLAAYGAGRSILADKDGHIIAGNKTLEATNELGLSIKIIETDGNELVVVQRTDLTLDSAKGRELAIADNRVAQVSLDFDGAILAQLRDEGVRLDKFFDNDELDVLINSVNNEAPIAPSEQMDKAEEFQQKWQVKRGDLWIIPSKNASGEHRLLCSLRTTADVHHLMGNDRFRMIWSDPPYGVNYASLEDSRVRAGHTNNRKSSHIPNDDLKPDEIYKLVLDALVTSKPYALPKAGLYIAAPPGLLYLRFAQAVIDSGFSYRQQLIWLKNAPGFGRTDYHYQHEPIIYGWLDGEGSRYFVDDHTKTTIIEAQKPLDSDEHPTMKPVELVTQMIENSSKRGEIIYEPFAGSGSTLLACEVTGRLGRGIELEPKYCAVILERLAQMGLTPIRQNS